LSGQSGRGTTFRIYEETTQESARVLVGYVVVLDVRPCEVESETQPAIQSLVRTVDARLQPLEPAGDDDSLLIHVIHRGAVLRARRSTGEGEIVVIRAPVAEDRLFPVRVRGTKRRTLRRGKDSGRDLLVDVRAELVSGHDIQMPWRGGSPHVGIVLYARAGASTLLRLDEHDAVGGAGSIDGRSCVFQDRNGRNV